MTQIFPGIYLAKMDNPCDMMACLKGMRIWCLRKIFHQLTELIKYPAHKKKVEIKRYFKS